MNDVPQPLEIEAQETVEAYLEHDAAPETVLDRVAVLHHRGEYFEALQLIVEQRDPATDLGASPGTRQSGTAD